MRSFGKKAKTKRYPRPTIIKHRSEDLYYLYGASLEESSTSDTYINTMHKHMD